MMAAEPTDLAPLSEAEVADLAECEAVIERGRQAFYEVGAALATIRDTRLYRASFTSFETYCRDRWGFARSYANKIIAAADVVTNLGTNVPTLPTNEAQARPMAAVPVSDQPRVWQEVVETAPETGITAAHVTRTVAQFKRNESPVSLVPDAIIDPPSPPLPTAVMDILRSPEMRAATWREDFSRTAERLLGAVRMATRLVREVPPEEMAALLDESDMRDEPHIVPTLDWIKAVFAARHDTPAIRRIK